MCLIINKLLKAWVQTRDSTPSELIEKQKLTANIMDCVDEVIGYGKYEHWDDSGNAKFNQDVIIRAIEVLTRLYFICLETNFIPDLIVPGPASDGQSIDVEIQHNGSRLFFMVGDKPTNGDNEYFKNALNQFYEDLLKDQTQLPADIAKVLYDNLWELYEEG